jgi:hypothetical protein
MDREVTSRPKMADVRKPEKSSAPRGPEPLIIQPRPVIGRNISVSTSRDEASSSEPAASAPTPPAAPLRRPVIVPPAATGTPQTSPQHPKPAEAENTDAPEPAPKPELESEPELKPEPLPEATADKVPVDSDQLQTPGQPTPETRQAVEKAQEATKRAEALEKYISEREFFVPINAAARKRSIKVSFMLTFLLFLLGIVLIDLMLDSGLIYLIQHIPHTNFFGD